MKILILGSGGRENAIAWRCSLDSPENEIFIAPGNYGTSLIGKNIDIDIKNFSKIKNFCFELKIDLVIVGSEEFLALGIVDYLESFGIIVFGPSKSSAKIESDKSFAKNFMIKYGIPTADYKIFNREQHTEALNYLKKEIYPIVIKVSGLAAGKGVTIATNFENARNTVEEIFIKNNFGISGEKIVIEQFLEGEEVSILVVTDGDKYKILPSSQDHKRIFDNDLGANTGGMGAYSPAPIASNSVIKKIEDEVIKPTLFGLQSENLKYKGCLYFGLMVDKNDNPFVIEYNSRFGDPETQAILPLIDGNFSEFLYSASTGGLIENIISYKKSCSICVILSSAGYPGKYEIGKEILGLEEVKSLNECLIFHSGTKLSDGKVLTSGGRVLGITQINRNNDLIACKQDVYNAISKIKFDGMHYRSDIADKGIKRLQ